VALAARLSALSRLKLENETDKSELPVTRKFGRDFNSQGGALTLDTSQVTLTHAESGTHARTHASGWTITGEIQEDYYVWINEFKATHPELGCVEGDFEGEVKATSEEAFEHFWKHHQPEAWDYHDI